MIKKEKVFMGIGLASLILTLALNGATAVNAAKKVKESELQLETGTEGPNGDHEGLYYDLGTGIIHDDGEDVDYIVIQDSEGGLAIHERIKNKSLKEDSSEEIEEDEEASEEDLEELKEVKKKNNK